MPRLTHEDSVKSPHPAAREGPPQVRWQWMPSAFAILALLLLLVVPSLVNRRISELNKVTLRGEHARVLLNDLEAAFASQLLVRGDTTKARIPPTLAAPAHLDIDAAELQAIVSELGPTAAALEYEFTSRLVAWKSSPHVGPATAQEGLDVLAAAERLDSYLQRQSDVQRDEVLRLARYYVLTPAVLAPIALIAIMLIVASARRERHFAELAQAERAQVVLASEAHAALLRGVTHDVKNPLGAAAGFAQLLEDGIAGPLPPAQIEMVNRIHRLVQVAAQTVTDLLELARADGELHIEYATVDLAALVQSVVQDHDGVAREQGLDVSVDVPLTSLVTDPLRVRQILTNLLSNAIKYTPSGGHVHVTLVSSGNIQGKYRRIGVQVQDTGPGIPPELHSKVFEEFFRVRSPEAAASPGNGLGLAISRRIARLIGGDVTFANADGGGAAFTLWLTSTPSA